MGCWQFYTERFRPEVQPLTLIYPIFDRNGTVQYRKWSPKWTANDPVKNWGRVDLFFWLLDEEWGCLQRNLRGKKGAFLSKPDIYWVILSTKLIASCLMQIVISSAHFLYPFNCLSKTDKIITQLLFYIIHLPNSSHRRPILLDDSISHYTEV